MKLLGSTTKNITNDKYGENVPHLEITEVVLAHCSIVTISTMIINKIQEFYIHLF